MSYFPNSNITQIGGVNVRSTGVQDGQARLGVSEPALAELLYMVLAELRIQTQMLSELPLMINRGTNNFDDPQNYRNDPTFTPEKYLP